MSTLPDPLSVPWPRRSGACLLRPLREDDVDAMLGYRSRPEVSRFLSGPGPGADRSAVLALVRQRTQPPEADALTLTRGLAVLVDGRAVGDAVMSVVPDPTGAHGDSCAARVWIGFVLHPDVWREGYGTDVTRCLVQVATELGLTAWTATTPGDTAAERSLEDAGLRRRGQEEIGGVLRTVYASA